MQLSWNMCRHCLWMARIPLFFYDREINVDNEIYKQFMFMFRSITFQCFGTASCARAMNSFLTRL